MTTESAVKPKKLSVSDELAAIEERDGKLSSKAVLKYARRSDSALHKLFPWDDHEAAEAHRLKIAEGIIRARVTYLPSPEAPAKMVSVRKYVSLTTERGEGVYRNIENVLDAPKLRKVLLDDAKAELRSIRFKYSNLAELSGVHREIDKVI